jgi:hypothetical protein
MRAVLGDSHSGTRSRSLENTALTSNVDHPSTWTCSGEPRTDSQQPPLSPCLAGTQGKTPDPTPIDRDRFQPNRTAHPADPTPKFRRKKFQENSAKSQEKPAVPTSPTIFYLIVTTLSSTNTTLAGVAQSVERVALINSKEINLKVVGSSPTFGYSYHIKLIRAAVLFCFFAGGFGGCGCRRKASLGVAGILVLNTSCFLIQEAGFVEWTF